MVVSFWMLCIHSLIWFMIPSLSLLHACICHGCLTSMYQDPALRIPIRSLFSLSSWLIWCHANLLLHGSTKNLFHVDHDVVVAIEPLICVLIPSFISQSFDLQLSWVLECLSVLISCDLYSLVLCLIFKSPPCGPLISWLSQFDTPLLQSARCYATQFLPWEISIGLYVW